MKDEGRKLETKTAFVLFILHPSSFILSLNYRPRKNLRIYGSSDLNKASSEPL